MEHINFSIKKNLIYLKLNNNENVFNNGLVYFLNLDNFKNFFHISDINYIPNIKNYIIFVNKFRDNLDILEKLKNKFKFIAINLSFECFWFFLKLDTKCEEKIIYDKNNFDIKLKLKLNSYFYKQINNQKASHLENKEIEIKKNFILDNIDKLEYEIKQYKERILNESVEKLNGEYIKIKKNIKKLNEQIKKLDLNITNSNCSKQINIEEIYNKENILQEIRELKKKNWKLIK